MKASSRTPREQCIATITRLQGKAGVAAFLSTPQPALGDRTGAQLLQSDPQELLRRLKALEADLECQSFDDTPEADPVFDRIPERRHSRGSGRIFAILDQLEKGGCK